MTKTTVKRVRRSVTADGNSVTLRDPKAITVCKKPSNQRAFSVLRSEEAAAGPKRMRRARRSENNRLARLELDANMNEEQVTDYLKTAGLSSFSVARSDDTQPWVATNGAIVCTEDQLLPHKISEEVTAFVVRVESEESTAGKNKLVLAAIRFEDDSVSQEEVTAWLNENGVDFDEKSLNNSTGNYVLQRSELEADEETRQIELAEGVVGVVARAAFYDVPAGFVMVVNEMAYTGWGWGQLDFNAFLADCTVGEAISKARYYLWDVMDNILYYNNDLTIEAKKLLIGRSANQFADYVNQLLDALPRQLLIPITTTEATTQRSEAVKEPATMTTTAAKSAATPAAGGLTLEDVRNAIRADREEQAAEVKRKEEAEAETKRVEEARRTEINEIVQAATKPLLDEIASLKGTTVVRSAGENVETAAKGKVTTEKRTDAEIFSGCMGNFGGLRDIHELEEVSDADDSAEETE